MAKAYLGSDERRARREVDRAVHELIVEEFAGSDGLLGGDGRFDVRSVDKDRDGYTTRRITFEIQRHVKDARVGQFSTATRTKTFHVPLTANAQAAVGVVRARWDSVLRLRREAIGEATELLEARVKKFEEHERFLKEAGLPFSREFCRYGKGDFATQKRTWLTGWERNGTHARITASTGEISVHKAPPELLYTITRAIVAWSKSHENENENENEKLLDNDDGVDDAGSNERT